MKLSASKVDTFNSCKRLFLYRYLRKPFIPPESKYFLIGNIAHAACEHFHRGLNGDMTIWPEKMGKVFKDAVISHNAFAKIRQKVITRDDLKSIKEMLASYLDYTRSNAFPDIFSLEKFFSFTLYKDEIDGNILVNGKADRVDKIDENTYCVVDYKTSSKPASRKDELDSVQIPTYAMWVRSFAKKDTKVIGKYMYLKHLGVKNGIHEFEVSEEMVKNAKEQYRKVNIEINAGKCKFTQNLSYKFCRNCDFHSYCLKDENDLLEG